MLLLPKLILNQFAGLLITRVQGQLLRIQLFNKSIPIFKLPDAFKFEATVSTDLSKMD